MSLTVQATGPDGHLDATGNANELAIMRPSGPGKGHPLDTGILPPGGWTALGKLMVGDEVVGSDGLPVIVAGILDKGVRPLHRVSLADGASVVVDSEHLWSVTAHHGTSVRETSALGHLTRTVGKQQVLRWSVPTVSAVVHPSQVLPLEPYILGCLLANGYFGDRTQLTVAFGPEWQPLVDEVYRVAPPWMQIAEVTSRGSTARQFSLHDCQPILRDLGLEDHRSPVKFIPEKYLRASIEQRRALLAGLMDCDGGCHKGMAWYYSTSAQLAAEVVDLVNGLGGVGVPVTQQRSDGKPTEFNVKVYMEENPFRHGPKEGRWAPAQRYLKRRIKSVVAVGVAEVRCIRVDAVDQLYVTEGHIVTHDTRSARTSQ